MREKGSNHASPAASAFAAANQGAQISRHSYLAVDPLLPCRRRPRPHRNPLALPCLSHHRSALAVDPIRRSSVDPSRQQPRRRRNKITAEHSSSPSTSKQAQPRHEQLA
ncbi:hypothetical protein M0R45_030674 [Rubus argutus]|uniref:Uncharacterized protein n=1 Tax=Rubus argutus TaxID=59490 RepID=A0AAW1WED2_RUBAR